jgi:hypothetical protein
LFISARRHHEWALNQREEMTTRKDVFKPPSTSGPQPHPFASSPALIRSERRWWPFTDVGAAVVGGGGEHTGRVDTRMDVNFSDCVGSSSRPPLSWDVSGDRHLPFRLRPGSGGGNFVGYASNTVMIKRPPDPVVIEEAPDDTQRLEVYLVFTLK